MSALSPKTTFYFRNGSGFLLAYRSFFNLGGSYRDGVMKSAFILGAAALVASCVFAQEAFAQGDGFREARFRAAAPGYIGRPKPHVVIRPRLRWGAPPALIYYPYFDLPYVAVGTPPFYLAGLAGKRDSCWAWDGYQWLNFCSGFYPGY
jgi:hypothetical protein